MTNARQSMDRPGQWLLELIQNPTLYRQLFDTYGLAVGAYYVARARCVVQTSTAVPTTSELVVAAQEIVDRAGLDMRVPTRQALAEECEDEGLLVIVPIRHAA